MARSREGEATPVRIAATVLAKLNLARKCREELRNWPAVLLRAGLAHFGWSRGAFTVESRAGVILEAPNRVSAWYPLVEVLGGDSYRLRHMSWDDPSGPRGVLDIGAHVGSFTCALAERLPGATFTCVEPSPTTLAPLRANLVRNGLAGRAVVVPVAITNADGEAELWATEEASSEASLRSGRGKRVTVATMSFDSIVTAAGGRIQIAKLDCEGGEYASILGSSSESWATVEQLFLEYHPVVGHHFHELTDRLDEFGLNLVWQQRDASIPELGMAYFARGR